MIEKQLDRMIELLASIDSKLSAPEKEKGKSKRAEVSSPAAEAMVETAKAVADAALQEQQVLEAVAAEEEEEVTKEMVRLALVKMASICGQLPARQLLLEVGGAKTISQLEPSRMAAVYRAALDEADKG